MSLTLKANTQAIGQGRSTSFGASGGSSPYIFSILTGGAGGTIGSSSGTYTAPVNATGVDTVQVEDASLATAVLPIIVENPLELFCDIIKKEMNLASDQIYLWDQKFNIPKDSRLYVAVSVLSCKPFANTRREDTSGPGMDSIQSVNMFATLSVDIFSRSTEALLRKEEIVLALGSQYAEQQQELNSFSVGLLPVGFVNLSNIDGAAIPYRFNISFNMQYFYRKTKAVDYFDDFSEVEVTTEA